MQLIKQFGSSEQRYFSLARYALLEALNILRLPKGSKVLIPEYICRDVLAPIHLAGLKPVFYSINKTLEPESYVQSWPSARVVIAVNYFGFPQDLTPFNAYCDNNGAILIEDNAHGFLSKDQSGAALGFRASIGIFSFRKTLNVPNGAALVVQKSDLVMRLGKQLDWSEYKGSAGFRVKYSLSRVPWLGHFLVRYSRVIVRLLHIRLADEISENFIPSDDRRPSSVLKKTLECLNEKREINRRRELYMQVEKTLSKLGAVSVYPSLGNNTVPYGYPFFLDASPKQIKSINISLSEFGLEAYRWPSLPATVLTHCPEYYKNIWWVNFWKP